MQTSLSQSVVQSENVLIDLPNIESLKPISGWKVIQATIIKDLTIARRYLPDLIGQIVQLAIRAVFFLIFANIFSLLGTEEIGDLNGRNLFIFFQGGLLLLVFYNVAMRMPLRTIGRDLQNGTLEFLYSNPCSRYAYFVGTILSEAILAQVVFLPLYITLLFFANASAFNMLMVFLVCIVVLAALSALGIMIGLLGILWRQAGNLESLSSLLFEMLAGAYFPITVMPLFMQRFAYLVPHTWGYDLIRYYSFNGEWKTILPVWQEWIIILVFAIFFIALSRFLHEKAERRAKENGLHLI